MTDQFSALGDAMDTLVAMTAGYRAKLEAAGFSPTAAEQMAGQFHSVLLDNAFRRKK